MIDQKYFKEYRKKLGFTSKQSTKKFFSGKDITPDIDYTYIQKLNERLREIVININDTIHHSSRVDDIQRFCDNNIDSVFNKLKNNNIIPKLNNQGRRPEQVYFSWMRGFIVANYFTKALCNIFQVDISDIYTIGDDDLNDIKTFKRTPKADVEINLGNDIVRLEIQSGFQGVNDIKQHKVIEAKRLYRERAIDTIAIHFDLFNGQVAFIKLNGIEDNDVNWITRQQMEGQTVFNIDQNYFIWKLTHNPPKYKDISREI